MPTTKFERLPEQKKKRIVDAVLNELLEESADKVNVSHIARRAAVSRGSIYAYFRGKEDMLLFSLRYTHMELLHRSMDILTQNNGDFWNMLTDSLELWIRECTKKRLCQPIYLPGGSGYTPGIIHTYPGKDWMQMYKNWMYDNCTNQEIKDLGRESFDVFQDLCQSFLLFYVQAYLTGTQDREDITDTFKQKLHPAAG